MKNTLSRLFSWAPSTDTGLAFFTYYQRFGITAAIIPALIVGIYALWEVVFVYGWLQLRFEEAFGIVPAGILAGLCFSLYHLAYGWYDLSGLVGLFIFGLIFYRIQKIKRFHEVN